MTLRRVTLTPKNFKKATFLFSPTKITLGEWQFSVVSEVEQWLASIQRKSPITHKLLVKELEANFFSKNGALFSNRSEWVADGNAFA